MHAKADPAIRATGKKVEMNETDKQRGMEIEDRFAHFLEQQNQSWPLSASNYRGLAKVEEKSFSIGGWTLKVQFNPERIRSSAAKVDAGSIAARKCFLCRENRPPEQLELETGGEFLILVNPYPIFRHHFTITSLRHTDQRILANLATLLSLAREMEGYTLFYNGPECGASAPDHLHFQAGEKGFMPVDTAFERLKWEDGALLMESATTKIWAFDTYLRKMISLETSDAESGVCFMKRILETLGSMQPEKAEPMINLLCSWSAGKWILHLFPRKLHRPSYYFAEGEAQLLISPASVDLGGVFITPRREDFEKITSADILDIFDQIGLEEDKMEHLKQAIRNDGAKK
ncbi:MAG: DUF4922 domain-containing protein [Marinilabiliales bacterium]|nr:DUF4922 domain-containing protein [Marinilabiliales bacterium]